MICAEEHLLY